MIAGYGEYKPGSPQARIIRQVQDMLYDELFWVWPVTVRQIFYRMIAKHGYDKSDKALSTAA